MFNATKFERSLTRSVILESKNGVDLRAVIVEKTETVTHYEIYMDGEFLNKFADMKKAKSMWKDFSC